MKWYQSMRFTHSQCCQKSWHGEGVFGNIYEVVFLFCAVIYMLNLLIRLNGFDCFHITGVQMRIAYCVRVSYTECKMMNYSYKAICWFVVRAILLSFCESFVFQARRKNLEMSNLPSHLLSHVRLLLESR